MVLSRGLDNSANISWEHHWWWQFARGFVNEYFLSIDDSPDILYHIVPTHSPLGQMKPDQERKEEVADRGSTAMDGDKALSSLGSLGYFL